MKKTYDIVKDSLFCAIVCTLIIISNMFAMLNNILFSFFLVVFIACYFQNKKAIRPVMSSAVILAISFFLVNPLDVLIFILPGLILGIIASLFLERFYIYKSFYLVLSVIFFIVNFIMELGYAKLIMNIDFIEYILLDEVFFLPESIANFTIIMVLIYFILVALISFMEAFILKNSNIIYKKRIKKIKILQKHKV